MKVDFINQDYEVVTVRWNAVGYNGSFTLRQQDQYPIDGGSNDVTYAWLDSDNNIRDGEFRQFGVIATSIDVVFGTPDGQVK